MPDSGGTSTPTSWLIGGVTSSQKRQTILADWYRVTGDWGLAMEPENLKPA